MDETKVEQTFVNSVEKSGICNEECRVCLKKCNEVWELFRQSAEDIPRKLMACAAVQVEEGDGLPTIICETCRRLLDVSYDFKCQVERSDSRLREFLIMKHPVDEVKIMTLDNSVDATLTEVMNDEISYNHSAGAVVECTDLANALTVPTEHIVTSLNVHHFTANGEQIIFQIQHPTAQDGATLEEDINLSNESVDEKHLTLMNCQQNGVVDVMIDKYEELVEIVNPKDAEMMDTDESEITEDENSEYIVENATANDNSTFIAENENSTFTAENENSTFTAENENSTFTAQNGNSTFTTENENSAFIVKNENSAFIVKNENSAFEAENENSAFEAENENSAFEAENENPAFDAENLSENESIEQNDEIDEIRSNADVKDDVYDSDEEEKPLINRTQRQKCSHCIKTFATKAGLERHAEIHKMKLRYVCYMCDKQFPSISNLKSHVLSSHDSLRNDEKTISEEITSKSTRTEKQQRGENKRNMKFSCKICGKQFTYQKSFMTHAKTHAGYKPEATNEKDREEHHEEAVAASEDSNERGNESDDDDMPVEGLQCTQCGKLFATKRNLKRHISTHSGLKFHCSTCGKEFSRIDKLKEHEQSKHNEELFASSDSDSDVDTDNENKNHDVSDGKKKEKLSRPHQCSMCPKAFAMQQSLTNHMERHKRVKDTQKRFLCEVCSKCFAQSGSLVAHMRTHTGVKPYVCNVCSRAFTKSTYLQLHLRTHSGEKPYICQYCSRAFARANTLARHITMHTGEAKYQCQICTKSFRRLTSLNEHTYTHTGQRPYACKICTKRYNNAGSLYAHTKKCKAQQLSAEEGAFQDIVPPPHMKVYPAKKKLLDVIPESPVTTSSQFMLSNVPNPSLKSLPPNIVPQFPVEDPNFCALNKPYKNPYYTIYPNM